ncbi:hypothetical protein BG011_009030 [Mortierella polycephala]|uniref:DUF202 domain-containing protein n=1 Tax=Mortierella polycephala TaxID=41804 RepID=A0A9P6PPY7_9FUNG|nr:hypothetical protein BG011_009030 [Mortierella polycephala]
MQPTDTASFQDNAHAYSGASVTRSVGDDVSKDDRHVRRSTNPFASWMDPIEISLDPFRNGQSSDVSQSSDPSQFPTFSFSLSSSLDTTSSQPSNASLNCTPIPKPAVASIHSRSHQHQDSFTPSTQSPTTATTPPFSSSASNNPFVHTPYQPPSTRQHEYSATQQYLSLGGHKLQEPEPNSSSASTLVGLPMTPPSDSQRRSSWLSSSGQHTTSTHPPTTSSSPSPSNQHEEQCSGAVASTFPLIRTGSKGAVLNRRGPFCNSDGSLETLGHDFVGPASAARTLGYSDRNYHTSGQQAHGKFLNNPSIWEPHVSVPMDDIPLESVTSTVSPATKNQRNGRGLYSRGTVTPKSEFDMSTNASTVTLLAQTNTLTASASSTTLFGGFLSKSKSHTNFQKLAEPEELVIQHQTISMISEGKTYSKRPKQKQFGKKKGGQGGGGKGDGGNGDRRAMFANERTFINWIKFGILLGTMALTLSNFGTTDSLAFYIGFSILVIAMSALAYAATSFHRRDRSLTRRLNGALARKKAKRQQGARDDEPSLDPSVLNPQEICYYDRLGPTILCVILFFAYTINFYLSITGGADMNKGGGLSYFHPEDE